MENVKNGFRPILCICVCITIDTMLNLMVTLTQMQMQTQTSSVNTALSHLAIKNLIYNLKFRPTDTMWPVNTIST